LLYVYTEYLTATSVDKLQGVQLNWKWVMYCL